MTDRFLKCIPIILENEGGLTNNEHDPGGLTNFGISQHAYPGLDIKNLTIDQAKEIYYNDYWLPLFLEALNDEIAALQIFDMGVNSGIVRAARIAQEVSGALIDGHIGTDTITAINNTECFVDKYKVARINFYSNLGNADVFLRGWIKRVNNCKL